jgi:hypothetical protein
MLGIIEGSMRMRVLRAAALIALLVGPAYAQKQIPQYGEEDKDKTPQQIEADKAAERAYKNSLGNIPDRGPSDPWGTMRSGDTVRNGDTPKPAAKSDAKSAAKATPAKPQAKTSSTAN